MLLAQYPKSYSKSFHCTICGWAPKVEPKPQVKVGELEIQSYLTNRATNGWEHFQLIATELSSEAGP